MPAVSFTVPARVITAICLRNGVADSQANFETIMKGEWQAITEDYEGSLAEGTTVADARATAKTARDVAVSKAKSEITIT